MADGLKDRKLQDYYESLQTMFSTNGWTYLTEDLTRLLEAADSLNSIESEKDLHFRRGQVDILKKIIAQPVVIAAAYENLLTEE